MWDKRRGGTYIHDISPSGNVQFIIHMYDISICTPLPALYLLVIIVRIYYFVGDCPIHLVLKILYRLLHLQCVVFYGS